MDSIHTDLMTALPEMVVLGMAMVVLLADFFISAKDRILVYTLTQITLLVAAFLIVKTHTPWVSYAFTAMWVDDTLGDILKLMTLLGSFVMLVYTRQYMQLRGMYRGEYYALVLFALLGMMVMISGNNLLTIYIGLELLSLSLYALVALNRDSLSASEAAMKYFVLGALASGMLLYGMSMIYGMTGTLDLGDIMAALRDAQAGNPVLAMGLVFVVAGVGFKFGAAPFQMWVPDVYQGSPTAITLLVGSVPKFSAFAMAIRLLVQGLEPLSADWQQMLLMMAVLSIVIGNITAIAQTNLKRMLAYSTISHIGFLLFGLMSASLNGYASSMLYVCAYVLMTLAGFGMILLLSRQGFEADKLEDLKGLNQRSPWAAFLMLITMFSMAGVPPTIGFYAKLSVLQAAWQAGFTLAVVFAVLMAVIGAFYYLRIVKLMYFDQPIDNHPIVSSMEMKALLSLNVYGLVVIGLMPQTLMGICALAISSSLQ